VGRGTAFQTELFSRWRPCLTGCLKSELFRQLFSQLFRQFSDSFQPALQPVFSQLFRHFSASFSTTFQPAEKMLPDMICDQVPVNINGRRGEQAAHARLRCARMRCIAHSSRALTRSRSWCTGRSCCLPDICTEAHKQQSQVSTVEQEASAERCTATVARMCCCTYRLPLYWPYVCRNLDGE
jgi:hypothetical protein